MRIRILRRKYKLKELFILKWSFLKILLSPRKIINFLLVKISLTFKLRRSLGLPFNILIEPTGDCNYECIKCARFSNLYADDGPTDEGKSLSFDQFSRIIDEIGDALLTLRLWHYGEPFLNRDLYRMIEYAKRKNIIVALSSNLSMLNEGASEKLVESGLDYLIVAMDGASDASYALYHGKKSFETVMRNLDALVRTKRKLKSSLPLIEIQFIVMKKNEGEVAKIKNIARDLGVDKLTYIRLDATYLNFERFKSFRSEEDVLPRNKQFRLNVEAIKRIDFCRIPWEETLIRYSGLVLPCAADYGQRYQMGRLFQVNKYVGFKKIWNSKQYRIFRQEIRDNLNTVDTCCRCTKRDNTGINQILLEEKY